MLYPPDDNTSARTSFRHFFSYFYKRTLIATLEIKWETF